MNYVGLFPAFGVALLDGSLDKYDISSVKNVMSGGAAFPINVAQDLIKKFNFTSFREG